MIIKSIKVSAIFLLHLLIIIMIIFSSINIISGKSNDSPDMFENIKIFFTDSTLPDVKPREEIFLQQTDFTCGPACVAFVMTYFGLPSTEKNIALIANTTTEGTSMLDLVNSVKKMGFNAWGEQMDFDDLSNEKFPMIAYYNIKHYIVILAIEDKYIIAFDPGKGIVKITISEFFSIWDGYVMKIRPYKNVF